jgi:hypothetical protein
MMSILVFLWKLSPKDEEQLFEVNYIDEKANLMDEDKKSFGTQENDQFEIMEEDKKSMKLENLSRVTKEEKNGEERASTPLTPRELFFYDLIEGANNSFNSSTKLGENRRSADGEKPQEFFIASVSPTRSCVANVFMFVNPNEQPNNIKNK